MNKFRLSFFFLAMLVFLLGLLVSDANADEWWQRTMGVETKIGDDRDIHSLDIRWPLSHSDESLVFVDARTRYDDDYTIEGNLGLAGRWANESRVMGLYGFFDRLETVNENSFYQGTAGFEYFREYFGLRLNGYFPESTTYTLGTIKTDVEVQGNKIQFQDTDRKEQALPGYDATLEFRLPIGPTTLFTEGTYFSFDDEKVEPVEGPRVTSRFELPLWNNSTFSLGAQWQEDDVRGERTFGIARLEVPFGSSDASRGSQSLHNWKHQRLSQRIERDIDIVTKDFETEGETRPASVVASGREQTVDEVYFAKSGASGSGTRSDPTDLQDAVSKAGKNGLVLISDNGGTYTLEKTVKVPSEMVLSGSGNRLTFQDPEGNKVTKKFSSSGRPILHHDDSLNTGPNILTLVDGSGGQIIEDVRISQGSHGIVLKNNNDVTVQNVYVGKSGRDGINIANSSQVTIKNAKIANSDSRGIKVDQSNTITIQQMNIIGNNTNIGGSGADTGIGILNSEDLMVKNIKIDTPGKNGIYIDNSNDIQVDNAEIFDLSGNSIYYNAILITNSGSKEKPLKFTNIELLDKRSGNGGAQNGFDIKNSDYITIEDSDIKDFVDISISFESGITNFHYEDNLTNGDIAGFDFLGTQQHKNLSGSNNEFNLGDPILGAGECMDNGNDNIEESTTDLQLNSNTISNSFCLDS